jgi:site-specific DNA-methyltransferase (adenine-specific)
MAAPCGPTASMYMEDCVAGMRSHIASASIDVVVTSPPYNLGIDYRSYNDMMPRGEYLAWTREWATEVARVLAPGGSFFLNVGAKPTDPWVPFDVASVMRELFELQNVIHWVKSIAINRSDMGAGVQIDGDIAVGHYKPIRSSRYVNDCHEYVFHFTHTGKVPLDRLAVGVPYQDKSNIARWRETAEARRDLRCRGNTWFIPYTTINSRSDDRPHPATFPPKLPQMCIELHGTSRCATVMDPFMGLGNSALACAGLGVDFVGFELDEFYFSKSVEGARRALASVDARAGRGAAPDAGSSAGPGARWRRRRINPESEQTLWQGSDP